jgi:hypothetical protein
LPDESSTDSTDACYSRGVMNFKRDYNKMLFLDAEDLAEAGIKEAYQSVMQVLGQYVSEHSNILGTASITARTSKRQPAE